MIWAVLATGPSMSQSLADQVRGRCKVVAVSDAWRLAPWADALASTDASWWKAHPEARSFEGRKFCAVPYIAGVETFDGATNANSAMFAAMCAVRMGARKVLLLGVDLHSPGQHFFGRHPTTLRSTSQPRLEAFKNQFSRYRPKGVEITNCTPGSALECYRRMTLEDCLAESQALAK